MNLKLATSCALLGCVLLVCASPALGRETEQRGHSSRRSGVWEFALERINSANVDYGAELERGRRAFLRQLDDSRLWAEAVGFALILSGWTLVLSQSRERRRREIVAAELLAQYHNALAEARTRLDTAIADNCALREVAQSAFTSSLVERQPMAASAVSAAIYLDTNFPSRARSRRAVQKADSAAINAGLGEPEQRLKESRERERRLEKELEKTPSQPKSPPSPRSTTPVARGSKSPP